MTLLNFQATQHAISDSLPLDSYLIKPFQRVARYKLFLEVRWLLGVNVIFEISPLVSQDMIKHFVKSDLNGKLKECYDHLKVITIES